MIRVILLLLVTTQIWANLKKCNFENKNYKEICQKVVVNGVPSAYANEFLVTNFNSQKPDGSDIKNIPKKHVKVDAKNGKKVKKKPSKHASEIVAHLQEYKEVYDYAEKKYGVNREIVAIILLKESKLGKIKLTNDALTVFNSMATKKSPASTKQTEVVDSGKTNLVNIITYCYKKGIEPEECNFPSSHSGAVGIPQFMPESFSYIAGYETKVGDLTRMEDAIVSTSNYLNKRGSFKKLIDWDKTSKIAETEKAWKKFSATHKNSSFVYEKSEKEDAPYNCFRCETGETAYVKEYAKKLMSFNNSSDYALEILKLAYNAHIGLSKS